MRSLWIVVFAVAMQAVSAQGDVAYLAPSNKALGSKPVEAKAIAGFAEVVPNKGKEWTGRFISFPSTSDANTKVFRGLSVTSEDGTFKRAIFSGFTTKEGTKTLYNLTLRLQLVAAKDLTLRDAFVKQLREIETLPVAERQAALLGALEAFDTGESHVVELVIHRWNTSKKQPEDLETGPVFDRIETKVLSRLFKLGGKVDEEQDPGFAMEALRLFGEFGQAKVAWAVSPEFALSGDKVEPWSGPMVSSKLSFKLSEIELPGLTSSTTMRGTDFVTLSAPKAEKDKDFALSVSGGVNAKKLTGELRASEATLLERILGCLK